MSNKYLSKIASVPAPKASLTSKVGLGVSAASLGVGAANFYNNHKSHAIENQRIGLEKERVRLQEEQKKLDEKSLAALRSINRNLGSGVGK